jgi:hypothetical protein
MLQSSGVIEYDPYRGDMANTQWWCVMNTDNELCRYYREWVQKNPTFFGETRLDLIQPSWKAHVSLVRGETPREEYKPLWKKYHRKKVKFDYDPVVRRTGDTTGNDRPGTFFFLDVYFDLYLVLRGELGLQTERDGVPFKGHLTIGRTND